MRKPLLLTCVVLGASSVAAQAVGFRTQMSCAGDYYAYCSQHAPGSPGVRKCMRSVGPKLSKGCINALIADGEVSKADIEQHKQKLAGAKAKPKAAEPKKDEVAAAAKKAQPDAKKDSKKTDVAQKDGAQKNGANKKPVATDAKGAAATKVAAAAPVPKPKAATRASAVASTPAVVAPVAPAPAALPEAQTVSLDQQTFEALKNRGPVFLAEDGETTIAAQSAAQPTEQAPNSGVANDEGWQARVDQQPAAAEDATAAVETTPASNGAAEETVAGVSADSVQPPVAYPPGRMSLGRKLSSATPETEPVSWWDQLVEAVTGE